MKIRLLVLAGALCVALVACGSGEPDGGDETASATSSTTTPTTTAVEATDAPTTTVRVAALAVFETPTDASVALFDAWMAGDLAAAQLAALGPADELELLFATPIDADVRRRTCSSGEFGTASCFFGNGQGGVNVEVDAVDGGWSIALIDPFS